MHGWPTAPGRPAGALRRHRQASSRPIERRPRIATAMKAGNAVGCHGRFASVSMLAAGAAPAIEWPARHVRLRRRARVTGWHRMDDDDRQGRSPHG